MSEKSRKSRQSLFILRQEWLVAVWILKSPTHSFLVGCFLNTAWKTSTLLQASDFKSNFCNNFLKHILLSIQKQVEVSSKQKFMSKDSNFNKCCILKKQVNPGSHLKNRWNCSKMKSIYKKQGNKDSVLLPLTETDNILPWQQPGYIRETILFQTYLKYSKL